MSKKKAKAKKRRQERKELRFDATHNTVKVKDKKDVKRISMV